MQQQEPPSQSNLYQVEKQPAPTAAGWYLSSRHPSFAVAASPCSEVSVQTFGKPQCSMQVGWRPLCARRASQAPAAPRCARRPSPAAPCFARCDAATTAMLCNSGAASSSANHGLLAAILLPLPLRCLPGVEAGDVGGALRQRSREKGLDVRPRAHQTPSSSSTSEIPVMT